MPCARAADELAARRMARLFGLVALLLLLLAGCRLDERFGAEVRVLTQGQALAVGTKLPAGGPPADADWQPVTLPDAWDTNRPDYQGYVWYRLHFATPTDVAQPLALYLPALSMNAAAYLNGHALGSLGRMHEPVTRHFYTPLMLPLPPALLKPPGEDNELQLLVMGYRQYRSGLHTVYVGPAEALQPALARRHFWQNTGTLITSVLVLGLSLSGAVLWARARPGAMYAWFTLATLVWGLRNLNFVLTDNPWDNLWWNEISLAGALAFVGLFTLFAGEYRRWMLKAPPLARWRSVVPLVFIAASAIFLLPADTAALRGLFRPMGIAGLLLALWTQWTLIDTARRVRTASAWTVAVAGVVYLVLMLHDLVVANDLTQIDTLFLRQYAALPMFMAVTLVWTQRYRQAFAEIERLSQGLAQQVEAQRQALERNYRQLLDAERERALSQERERLVSELHDGLGLHLLTALQMARSGGGSPQTMADALQDCLDELRVSIDSMSNIDERDPVLLLGSLRFRLAPRLRSAGVQLDWQVLGDVAPQPWLDASNALHLLRIVQEALSNAVRHGHARRVLLKVEAVGRGVAVSVVDDGIGFDATAGAVGLGLAHMRKRAATLGARLSIEPGASGGTVVRLVAPSGAG